jgi:hypothetical protein
MGKRDHYVPAHHLARFRIEGTGPGRTSRINVAFAGSNDWKETSVERVGVERGLYSTESQVGCGRDIDPAFKHPENIGLNAFREFLDGRNPTRFDDAYRIGEYIASLCWRTPIGMGLAVYASHFNDGPNIIRDGKPGFSAFDDDLIERLGGKAGLGPGIPRTEHEFALTCVSEEIQSMALSISYMRWEMFELAKPGFLVTSDQPVVWDGQPENWFTGFGSIWVLPTTRIIFPVSPTQLFVAFNHRQRGAFRPAAPVGADKIDPVAVNQVSMKFARRFIASPNTGFPGDGWIPGWRAHISDLVNSAATR